MQPHAVPDPDFPARLRAQAAAFIGARPEQVALNRNTTDGFTAVVMGWPLARGDEILTSSQEHGPFYGTFAMREARDGVTWRTFHIPTPARDPKEIVEAVAGAMGPKTRLVALCHTVLTGQILPIAEIAKVVHARGALLLVDGALSLGHVATDVHAMDCDFFAGSFHKAACGPIGTGILYVKPEHVERLMPLYGAAREEEGRHRPLWNSPTMDKFQSFGQHPQATRYGLSASLAFFTAIGMDRIQARLFELTRYWVERARSIPGIRFAAPLDPRLCASLMGFEVTGTDSAALSRALVAEKIYMGGTGPYAGLFGIPEDAPRGVRCVNTALFLTRRDLDRFTETLARHSRPAARSANKSLPGD